MQNKKMADFNLLLVRKWQQPAFLGFDFPLADLELFLEQMEIFA